VEERESARERASEREGDREREAGRLGERGCARARDYIRRERRARGRQSRMADRGALFTGRQGGQTRAFRCK